IGSNEFDPVHNQYAEARRILSGLGLFEAQGQTLISDTAARLVSGESIVRLANPLSSDMNVLRPSLLPGLLDSLRHNISQKVYDVALFEVGRVFGAPAEQGSSPGSGRPNTGLPGGSREDRILAIALTGQRDPVFWSGDDRGAKFDVYDLKGILGEF